MEDSNTLEYAWEERYTNCQYAEKLLNRLSELNQQVTQPVDINEIQKGIYYAKKYHGSQIRQSGDPYYSHPIDGGINGCRIYCIRNCHNISGLI